MRADVNLSVRKSGGKALGTRTEMKNLNSFHDIADAVKSEAERQIALIESGESVVRQTRRWDADRHESFVMRSKENSDDYRYFPEPDIPCIEIRDCELESVRKSLPELPDAKKERYIHTLGLSAYEADILTNDIDLARFFEGVISCGITPKDAANWTMGEILRLLKDSAASPGGNPLSAETLSRIIKMVQSGKISRGTGKEVLEKAFYDGIEPEKYVEENSLSQITDIPFITAAVKKALTENGKSVADYRNGKQAALGYLVGQSMKALGGKADAITVKKIITELLNDKN